MTTVVELSERLSSCGKMATGAGRVDTHNTHTATSPGQHGLTLLLLLLAIRTGYVDQIFYFTLERMSETRTWSIVIISDPSCNFCVEKLTSFDVGLIAW